jgi:hypothetical protein
MFILSDVYKYLKNYSEYPMSSALPWKYKSNFEEPLVFSCKNKQGMGGLFDNSGVLELEENDEKDELLTSS